ncbi:MAG: hypothetical protein IJ772_04665 [Bacilli bacterium]|nr:hypothetical protein [Bacilli bacterium]
MTPSISGTRFYDIDPENSVYLEPHYDKAGYLLSSKDVVDHLLSHIVPVEVFRRDLDSAIKNTDFFTLTSDDINACLAKFDRNYGEFCDGKKFRFINEDYYFKFTSNIVISYDDGIMKTNDEQEVYSLLSLSKRSKNHFPTLSLYIDGVKIPDEEIYIYMGESCTDILIPYKYITKISETSTSVTYRNMEVYVQKHVITKHHYFNRYFRGVSTGSVSFEITDEELMHCVLKDKNFMVFSDGLYRQPLSYQISREGNVVTIKTGSPVLTGENIEVIVDSDIKAVSSVTIDPELGNSRNARYYFHLTEDDITYKLNYIYGPIPKRSCYFFLGNIRIPNNKVAQVGRMNFGYVSTNLATQVCTLIYTDRGIIDETQRYIYGEDYYISNILGVQNISKLLNEVEKGVSDLTPINKYICDSKWGIDFNQILNKKGKMYSVDYAKKINGIPKQYTDYESQTRALLKEAGNYLVRDYMNLYGKKEIFDTLVVPEEGRPEYYAFSFHEMKERESSTVQYFYIVDVNGDHIKDTDIVIKDMYQYDDILIPSSVFRTGTNRIHIREYKFDSGNSSDYLEYKQFNTADIQVIPAAESVDDEDDVRELLEEKKAELTELQVSLQEAIDNDDAMAAVYESDINRLKSQIVALEAYVTEYKYYYTFDPFKTIIDISDYTCLEISENNPNFYYDPTYDTDIGWVIKKDVEFIQNDDGTITLMMKEKPEKDTFVIYSKRFSFKYTTTVQKEVTSLEDISIPVHSSSNIRIPIIPSGGYSVYLNGERLFNGIDYVFRHPGNYDLIAYSSLALKRKTVPGDIITIYFTDVKNVTVDRSNDIISHAGTVFNKYGLIYFGSIEFPYSPRYIDLYINGKYIYPEQIDILSDKLIRVDQSIETPMFDIFAETSLSVDISKLNYFFNYEGNEWEDTAFEKAIKSLFTDYDFSTLTNPSSESSANTVYESFDENVDSWGRTPNTERDGETDDEKIEEAKKNVPNRYALLQNAYLLWLKSDAVKTIMKPSENINQKIVDFFKFYVEETAVGERQDVVINVKNTKLFNDLVFGIDGYPIKDAEKMKIFAKFISSENLPSSVNKENDSSQLRVDETKQAGTNFFEKGKNTLKLANVLYPRDFPKAIKSGKLINQENDLLIGGGVAVREEPVNYTFWRKK